MRVIAGQYRSRLIEAPKGLETRPTSDRLRERVFNILAPRIAGARVADLFAGSGAIGIEAISRGAGLVLFAENAPSAIAVIRRNLAGLNIRDGYTLSTDSVASTLRRVTTPFDIFYLDPPYSQVSAYSQTLSALSADSARLLSPDAIVVAEHRTFRPGNATCPVADAYGSLRRYRLIEQGEAAVSFFRTAEP